MKTSRTCCLLITIALLAICKGSSVGIVQGPTPFALMDLTELMKSLNTTYEELALSLQALNKSASNQATTQTTPPQTVSTPPPPTTATSTPANKQVAQQKINQDTSQSGSTQNTQTVSKLKPYSLPSQTKTTPPSSAQSTTTSTPSKSPSVPTNTPAQTKSSPPLYSTTQPRSAKPPSLNPPTKDLQTKAATNSSTINTSTKTTQSGGSSKSLPQASKGQSSPKEQAPSSSNGSLPTYGPGPANKALPPVIDLTKIIVDYTMPTMNNTTTNKQPQAATNNPKDSPNKLQGQIPKQIDQKPNDIQSPTALPPKPKSSDEPLNKNNAVTDSTSKQTLPQHKPHTTIKNQVYLPPVIPSKPVQVNQVPKTTPPPSASPSVPLVSSLKSQGDESVEAYQFWTSNKNAIYSITPSYQAFSTYFIISDKDEYLSPIQSYLISNYGTYLSGQQVIGGFRLYNNYGDNSIDYQLLYLTSYGTFTAILTFSPDNSNIRLKSLSILNFFIMDITYPNCLQRDTQQQNCKICKRGYRNFMGRCRLVDPFCTNYITDECANCLSGRKLVQGVCQ